MIAERRALARLKRLEKLRAIARQTAAAESAQAENALCQLRALSQRTQSLAIEYAARTDASDGDTLRQVWRFVGGLQALTRSTDGDAARAQSIADAKQADLAHAERRRAAIEDRIAAQSRRLTKATETPALAARRGSGISLV